MASYVFCLGIVGLLTSTISGLAYAYSVEEQLRSFHEDPRIFMNSRKNIQKYEQKYREIEKVSDDSTELILESETPISSQSRRSNLKFPPESIPNKDLILGGDFVDIKNQFHEGIGTTPMNEGRALIDLTTDDPRVILGRKGLKYESITEMDRKKLTAGKLKDSPWSGDYWAVYTGQIAKRYADDNFINITDWRTISDTLTNTNASSIDNLSPAEKYDLLVGDQEKSLTQSMLSDGEGFYQRFGKIETWMGNCHGWAAAAYEVDRPKHDVEVMAWDGKTKVRFYPSDIKALATVLWAKMKVPTSFIGTRCTEKNPETDENGRVISQACFDTNPGTWHKTLINQVGYHRRSMIIDATFDYEVWNQPVYAYRYTYFNPETGEETTNLKNAIITLDEYKRDKFAKYRDRYRVKKIVGIAMKLIYIAETPPNHELKDSDAKDRKVAVNYLYDLELDEKDYIIGGEWYTNLHPDFIWTPVEKKTPSTAGDEYLDKILNYHGRWRNMKNKPIPPQWRESAIKTSVQGVPLKNIVESLVKRSRKLRIKDIFHH